MDTGYENYWLKKGTILAGKYRIKDVISEGGFGIVYLGFDNILKMDVAIKEYFPRRFAIREQNSAMIHAYKGKSGENFQEGLKKFLNEARILARFNDVESIVTVRDFFYENNTAYIINEHVVGETVKEHILAKGRMPSEKVLEIMKPILLSLGAIHEAGLIHRDISPDNIILKEEKAILIDFGAARSFQEQEDKSMTVFFKRGYSAQEQYVKNGKQSARTDVYALCATMYFMLTGIQPEESVQRSIKDTVVPLQKMRDVELNIWAKNAIMKGMSVSVTERYSSVAALYKELYGERRRLPLLPAVGLVVLLCLIVGYGIYWNAEKDKSNAWSLGKAEAGRAYNDIILQEDSKDNVTPEDNSEEIMADAAPTPETVVYKVPKVIGKKQKAAVKTLQKNSPSNVKITVKKKYSKEVEKGRVIRQSKKAGMNYQSGEIKKIVIWVSKGMKPEASLPVVQNTPTDTSQESGGTSQPAEQPKKNTEKNGNFAGALPW